MRVQVALCLLAVFTVAFFYYVSAWLKSRAHMLHGGLIATIAGAFMVMFGFWGSDAAFVNVLGGVHEIPIVLVGTYSCLDWWNPNWFITLMGSVILAWGTFMIGKAFSLRT